jgi:excisionase family DNA binding protein
MLTVKRAAEDLGLSPVSIRRAVMRGTLEVVPLDGRTYLVSREEVERYRRAHLGRRGKRMLPDEALTEQQRKQRAYQQAYYQRRKAARLQPATEPAE